ncbi:hypothetical protein BDF20DRAFT_837068 [Mycotypha africana]|uniref:uncharacterized protein n=1 Tax=Mycotypha africana TaxID=64632 RepID=UPI002301E510|nr:uncharacterized protein BDF20DRAFT_837068 [Mycotypha africana]KAI8975699.1 hypothetical protein BDF20DRAFT_837068 [Mycotypha africana]
MEILFFKSKCGSESFIKKYELLKSVIVPTINFNSVLTHDAYQCHPRTAVYNICFKMKTVVSVRMFPYNQSVPASILLDSTPTWKHSSRPPNCSHIEEEKAKFNVIFHKPHQLCTTRLQLIHLGFIAVVLSLSHILNTTQQILRNRYEVGILTPTNSCFGETKTDFNSY